MAKNKASDEVARGADVPLALASTGPRDALLDPREGDIIPGLEEKGYHVGEVAQPAEPVLHRGGDVTFESLPEAPESKFDRNSFADLKKIHNAQEADRASVTHSPHGLDLTAEAPAEAPAKSSPKSKAETKSTAPVEA